MERARLDSVSIAGIAVFSALATLLAAFSQSLGLNFPVIPYLQFDLGEIAIVMAFFIFGPLPAVVSSFVEFIALMMFGQNAPVGPILKLAALLSTVGGIWLGTKLASSLAKVSVRRVVASGVFLGTLTRVAVMTVANYYLIIFFYPAIGFPLSATVAYYHLPQAFSAIGLGLTDANALSLILVFTGVFNALQLIFVIGLSYTVLRFPPVSNLKVGGRSPWFISATAAKEKQEGTAG